MLESFNDFREIKGGDEAPVVLSKGQFQALLGLVPTNDNNHYLEVICAELVNDLARLRSGQESFTNNVIKTVESFMDRRSLMKMVEHRNDPDKLYYEIGELTGPCDVVEDYHMCA
jgi:hypothetical protein